MEDGGVGNISAVGIVKSQYFQIQENTKESIISLN